MVIGDFYDISKAGTYTILLRASVLGSNPPQMAYQVVTVNVLNPCGAATAV